MLRTGSQWALAGLVLASLAGGGCASTRAGQLSAVQPVSDRERAGNVYLLRGWIGVFSTGINALTEQIDDAGVRAHVYQADQWRQLASAVIERYSGVPAADREPLVLVGHSYGADDAVRIARRLADAGVAVDLIVTLDPVTPPAVPANVSRVVNLYQTNGGWDALPWLRGVPLRPDPAAEASVVQNVDIRADRPDLLAGDAANLDHFNIEKKATIHAEVIRQVMAACPPRQRWAAGRDAEPTPSRREELSALLSAR